MTDRFSQLLEKLEFYSVADKSEATEEAIHNFEAELGQSLPDDYREFLRHHGKTAASGLAFPDPDQPGRPGGGVGVFYGLRADGEYDLKSEWEGMKDRVPPGLLPIADSPGGLICLSLSGKKRGSILWWAAEDSRAADEDPYLVAPSFTDFLNSLYICES